jgi:hypothetical protein
MEQNESSRVLVASTAAGEAEVLDGTASNTSASTLAQAEATAPTAWSSWRDIVPIHPAAKRFRPPTELEKRSLRGDLKRHGQREPVVLVRIGQGPEQLIDGITRLDLQEANGDKVIDSSGKLIVPSRTVDLPDDAAAVAFVMSLNVYRRHLDLKERRDLVKDMLKNEPQKSDRQIGEVTKTDHKTVSKIRAAAEGRGEIPTSKTKTDTLGRKQPRKRVSKAATKRPVLKPDTAVAPTTGPTTTGVISSPPASKPMTHADPAIAGNPICEAWRNGSEEERIAFVKMFGDDVKRYGVGV